MLVNGSPHDYILYIMGKKQEEWLGTLTARNLVMFAYCTVARHTHGWHVE